MSRIKGLFALLFIFNIFFIPLANAQQNVIDFNEDLSSINVDDYTDEQLRELITQMEDNGYTFSDLEKVALLNNMPATEIAKLKQRLDRLRSRVDYEELRGKTNKAVMSENLRETEKVPAEIEVEETNLIFGSYLFNNAQLTFEPSLNIPTPKNYQLGPGDELIINIWGASLANYQPVVSRDGKIYLENIGPIYVNGSTIEKASSRIKGRLSQVYAGLRGSQPNTFIDISLGRLRSIRVNIIGEVSTPGTYTLSSMATLFNALYLSGGPSDEGSFREIEIYRENKMINKFDMYDFLINGDQSKNIVLKDQDIIKINPYKSRVEIVGEVKRPGIYEILNDENLDDLINFSAGFTQNAYTQRIKVLRKTDKGQKIITVSRETFKSFGLNNGDEINIDPIINRFENRVNIKGAVYRAGDYELTDSLSLKGLILLCDGLREDAYLSRANIFRLKNDLTTEIIPFNVETLMSGRSKDIMLKREDIVVISSVFDLKEEYFVEINGAVQLPGSYPFYDKISLNDLIIMAGGLTESASNSRIEIARRTRNESGKVDLNKRSEIYSFRVNKDLSLSENDSNFILYPFDRVYIRNIPGFEDLQSVNISGEVLYQGDYAIARKDERISDLVERAGGLTPSAYPKGATLMRFIDSSYHRIGIDLEGILKHPGTKEDLFIVENDRLYIPKELQTINVQGEVYMQSSVRYEKSFGFKNYISKAGGFTENALKRKSHIRYADGSIDRTRKIFFINNYPKVEPGAEIFVPERPERERISVQEVVGVSSGIATLSYLIISIVNLSN